MYQRLDRAKQKKPTFSCIRMRIRVKLIFRVRQPQSPICIEDFLTKRCEKFFKDATTVDSSPGIVKYSHEQY